MAATLTPEEVDEYIAADSLDPIDDSWQQAAMIAANVCNMLRAVLDKMTALGGGTPGTSDPMQPSDFIPMPEAAKQILKEAEQKAKAAAESGHDVKADHRKKFGSK